jgi:hypothetical protein
MGCESLSFLSLYSVLSALLITVSICLLHITVFSASVIASAAASINCLLYQICSACSFSLTVTRSFTFAVFLLTVDACKNYKPMHLFFTLSLSFTIHLIVLLTKRHRASCVCWPTSSACNSIQPMYSTGLISDTDKLYFSLSYMQLLNLVCHTEATCW